MTSEEDIAAVFNELSARFDKLCQERNAAGAAEYGAFTFVENDVVRMMAEELADTSNYCRMQFIKLMFLQEVLEDRLKETSNGEEGTITVGVDAFKGTKDVGWI